MRALSPWHALAPARATCSLRVKETPRPLPAPSLSPIRSPRVPPETLTLDRAFVVRRRRRGYRARHRRLRPPQLELKPPLAPPRSPLPFHRGIEPGSSEASTPSFPSSLPAVARRARLRPSSTFPLLAVELAPLLVSCWSSGTLPCFSSLPCSAP